MSNPGAMEEAVGERGERNTCADKGYRGGAAGISQPPDMVGCSAIQAVSHMATHKTWCGGGGGYLRVVAAYLARRGRRQESPGDETLHDAERTQQHGGVGGWSAPRKATAAFQTGSRPGL